MKKLLIVLFLLCSNANALDLKQYYKEDLTDVDKANIVLFNVLQTIDMLQTLEIANNDDYYEKNPILGKHPSEAHVVAYFVARGFAHYHLTNIIPQEYRNLFHGVNIIYNYNTIKNNHDIGIRIDF
tara:strand:- start:68 stop:445 length:378 start_codon:yes stop_codon:yes gene_type:complete